MRVEFLPGVGMTHILPTRVEFNYSYAVYREYGDPPEMWFEILAWLRETFGHHTLGLRSDARRWNVSEEWVISDPASRGRVVYFRTMNDAAMFRLRWT